MNGVLFERERAASSWSSGWKLLGAYVVFIFVVSLWPFDFYRNDVRWREVSNGIQFEKAGQVACASPSKWLYERLVGGSGLSLEVWLKAQNDRQTGPARIVSYSSNTTMRNFTLGQDEKKLVMRLRTVQTDVNGTEPHLEVDEVFDPSKPQHIVVTYDFVEQCVYIDGVLELCSKEPIGNFENLDPSHFLVLGKEATGDRPWVWGSTCGSKRFSSPRKRQSNPFGSQFQSISW